MSCIYWDTMLFVYFIEDHPDYSGRIKELHDRMRTRRDVLVTSIFTRGEVLTGAYKRNNVEMAKRVDSVMRPPTIELLPFTLETADRYARIRAENRVPPADAIHLASAAQAGVNLFLTNDKNLRRMIVPGIDFVAGLDVNLF